MAWYEYFAYFFAGAFFANSLPHLMAGVSGLPLQTPFASPPFRGLSSPLVNVAWALANLAASLLLYTSADALSSAHKATSFLGFSAMAFLCARSFSRIRKEANATE